MMTPARIRIPPAIIPGSSRSFTNTTPAMTAMIGTR
jgi:hypothetical protein